MIQRLSYSEAMSTALVGNMFWLTPWKASFHMSKKTVFTSQNSQTIKTILILEICHITSGLSGVLCSARAPTSRYQQAYMP